MFGYSQIAHQVPRWRQRRQRHAMENVIFGLPAELRKDIGWPVAHDLRQPQRERTDLFSRSIL